jgi:uncharacterized protein (DUF2249 family)
MKNSIVIGPIKKAKPEDRRHVIIRDRITRMKIGNFFEITGLKTEKDVSNIRVSLSYHSKKEGVKVSTTYNGGVLRVEKVRSETKSPVGV